jgi:hypothetical protein
MAEPRRGSDALLDGAARDFVNLAVDCRARRSEAVSISGVASATPVVPTELVRGLQHRSCADGPGSPRRSSSFDPGMRPMHFLETGHRGRGPGTVSRRRTMHMRRPFFLVVSRNLDEQDMYVQCLRARRLPAVGTETCEEVPEITNFLQLGAVLIDIDGSNGWLRLGRLRQALIPQVPIVVLSGRIAADRTYRNLARDLGCAGFVVKPATAETVVRALERAAEGSPWSEYWSPP